MAVAANSPADDVASQLEVLHSAQSNISYALAAISALPDIVERQALFPLLNNYIASDPLDIEVQQFNICCKIPERLQSNDALATWMLETDTLNRFNVAMYLASESTCNGGAISSTGVLDQISLSICSLDVGQRFVDGLKLFLPTTGALLLSSSSTKSARSFLLAAYARAHLQYSTVPVFPNTMGGGPEIAVVLAEIASCIVNLNTSISDGTKSLSVCMNDFFGAVRAAAASSSSSALVREPMLSIKMLTDLFNDTISGPPMAPLPLPFQAPQHLFASCRVSNSATVSLGSSGSSSGGKELSGWLVVEQMALYLFDRQVLLDDSSTTSSSSGSGSTMTQQRQQQQPQQAPPEFLLCVPLTHTTVDLVDTVDDNHHDGDSSSSSAQQCLVISPVFRALPVLRLCTSSDVAGASVAFPATSGLLHKSWHLLHVASIKISLPKSCTATAAMNMRDEIEAAIWTEHNNEA